MTTPGDAANAHYHRYQEDVALEDRVHKKLEEWRVCPRNLPVLGGAGNGRFTRGSDAWSRRQLRTVSGGRVASGRSRIRASMNAERGAWRPGSDAGVQPARWRPAADRPDPVALLEEQNRTREPDLVPVRHGRMMVSPFTFYRGAAKIMAADLKDTPTAGLDVAAVRRRAPVELRRVRLARADAAVRPERLRRDPAGAVRVRREADGGELHDRGAATTGSPRPTRGRRRWRR